MEKIKPKKISFWKWTFNKWYFWVIVIAYSLLISVDKDFGYSLRFTPSVALTSVAMHFAISIVLWSFIFWIFYLIFVGRFWKGKKQNSKNRMEKEVKTNGKERNKIN